MENKHQKSVCKHKYKFMGFNPDTFKAKYKCLKCDKSHYIQFIKEQNQNPVK